MPRNPLNLFFSVSFALVLVACVGQLQVKDVDVPSLNQGIVFGKLDLTEDGKAQPWKSFFAGVEAKLLISQPGSRKAMTYSIGGDGSFYWGLEPGDYTILGFDILNGGIRSGHIGATFTVSEEAKSVYIGNLKVLMEKGIYAVGIEDDYSVAAELFKNRFPKAQNPVKNLALLDEEPGFSRSVRDVCAVEWGINCTDKNFKGVGFIRIDGVTPLAPEASASAFPEIDSLLPTLEWNPSSMDDVSYDLIIYEAASYSRHGMDIQYMPGNLVVYKEDIKEAKFDLKNPLQPTSKYYWSVRLRRNDIVSTWSKFSYFQTVIIYTGSGRNQWFTFATPSE